MIRKLISALLALALLLPVLPTGAVFAEGSRTAIHLVDVNPEYAHLPVSNSLGESYDRGHAQIAGTGSYVSVEEAGAQVREAMKRREATISVSYYTSETDVDTATFAALNAGMEHTGVPTEGDYLLKHYHGANANGSYGYGYVNGVYAYKYDIVYTVEYMTDAAQEAELDIAIAQLLDQLDLDGQDDYHKFMAVYDYICSNITYDYDNLNDDSYLLKYSAYAALIHKTSVCQGYALLLYRLMLELGIDCRYISGSAGGPHGWNIVQMDGLYYNADPTWDAGLEPYSWCLLNDENFVRHTRNEEYRTSAFYADYPMGLVNYDPEGENPFFSASGVCGSSAYWMLTEDGVLSITGSGSMYHYGYYGEENAAPWASYKHMITELQIDSDITSIGHEAFAGCTALTRLDIPRGVTSIGYRAFYECTGLTVVSIAKDCSWTSTYNQAFYGCTNLTDLYLQNATIITYADQSWWDKTCLLEYVVNVYVDSSVTNVGAAITQTFAQGMEPESVEVDGVSYQLYRHSQHSYISDVTQPTCTEGGYTTYTCEKCGASYVDNFTEATGHSYVAGSCVHCGEEETVIAQIGDANDDGEVDYLDAMLIAQYYVGDIGDTDLNLEFADVNRDGEVDYLDAMMIAQYYVGDLDEL